MRRLWGIGPVAEEKLHRLGIDTIGAFAALSDAEAANILGAHRRARAAPAGPGHRRPAGRRERPGQADQRRVHVSRRPDDPGSAARGRWARSASTPMRAWRRMAAVPAPSRSS